ncbi:MAG: hypothetical protein NT070_23265 [Cyanobacteria bacterium]|nr:hypothetical protein [Cyanobacteriota bacterium]
MFTINIINLFAPFNSANEKFKSLRSGYTSAHLSLSNYLRITALSRTSYRTTHAALSLKIGEASCLLESICEQQPPNNLAIAHQLTELWAIVEEVTAITHQLME